MVIMKTKKERKFFVTDEQQENIEQNDNILNNENQVPKEILIIAQEVKIVQALACNNLTKRNRQLRKLRKWMQLRSQSSFVFTDEDFMRIWKGLYYNMWMSDKPLVQEELAEQLGQLLECFDGKVESSVSFFGAFVRTMCQEWFGIDQWRMDKFLMLTRRMLRYMFRVLRKDGWQVEHIEFFNKYMQETVLAEQSPALGLTMHFLDIFFEELAKVSEGNISADQVGAFVQPFVWFLGTQRDYKLVSHCRTRIFYQLLYQTSLGRDYMEKFNAWRQTGFATPSIDDLEKVETDSHEEDLISEEEPQTKENLDPRAGNVDVFMPELPLNPKGISDGLETLLYKREARTKCRKMLKKLLDIFQTYQSGEFPLGVQTMPRFERKSEKPLLKEKVDDLNNLENEMYSIGRKLKQMNKRKRRKLLKSLNFEEVDEDNFDMVIDNALPKQYLQERRKKVNRAMLTGWVEEEIEGNDVEIAAPIKKAKKNKLNEIKVSKMAKKIPKQKQVHDLSEGEPLNKMKKLDNNENNSSVQSLTASESFTDSHASQEDKAKSTIHNSEWNTALADGEIEYFIPSRKLTLKKANSDFVRNPLAKHASTPNAAKGKLNKTVTSATPNTPASVKRVKIALKHNTVQNPSEYIKQIISSPSVPYDADKKPGKGLLKPNSMPSPINPFYKKKIGLQLFNDTI